MALTADVVVVGGGMAGACAALAAREQGAKVLLVSRASGATTLSSGAIDFGAMGRIGEPDNASAIRTMLTYGITEDVQISASAPVVFGSAPLPAARMTGMMPGGGDFESILAWRFHRQGTNVGTRVNVRVPG